MFLYGSRTQGRSAFWLGRGCPGRSAWPLWLWRPACAHLAYCGCAIARTRHGHLTGICPRRTVQSRTKPAPSQRTARRSY